MITVLQPGVYTTIQDLGRSGYQRFGVPVSGAMDPFAYRLANLLAGNGAGLAALELTAVGPTLLFEQDTVFALAGADFSASLGGRMLRNNAAHFAAAGSTLSLGGAKDGFRGYLAAYGGFDGEAVMGSRSTYVKAGLGGYQGRPLQKGDALNILSPKEGKPPFPANLETRYLLAENLPLYRRKPGEPVSLRVVMGPQDGYFSREGLEAFFSGIYTVTGASDRMGYRLEGPGVARARGMEGNILSDGVAFGSIQVPDSGEPIVMMADRQTTGGYPKLGTVISADLPKLAQLRAGDQATFCRVELWEAQEALLEQRRFLASMERALGAGVKKRDFCILAAEKRYTVEVTQIG